MSTKDITIYISPANHHKSYAVKGRTEKEQMDKLAPILKRELEKFVGVNVILATVFSDAGDYVGRPEEAKKLGADYYIALHTNADEGSGKATGACVFYHPDYKVGKNIAKELVKNLDAIAPVKSNRATKPAIFAWSKSKWNFGELRVPAKYGICPVLIEHNFHSNLTVARWIINNLDEIAETDAASIAKVLGLKAKPIRGDANGDGKVNSMDASLILQHDANLITLEGENLKNADYNGDGKVTSLDASLVLRKDAGLID